MEQKIKSLITNMENVYGKEPWYGDSIKSILKAVDSKTIFLRPAEGSHNIAEILAHIIDCRDFTVQSISGNDNFELD